MLRRLVALFFRRYDKQTRLLSPTSHNLSVTTAASDEAPRADMHPYDFVMRYLLHMRVGAMGMPHEVAAMITSYVCDNPHAHAPQPQPATPPSNQPNTRINHNPVAPYYTPPAGCPLMRLSTELRKMIFAHSLPDRTTVHHPKCDDRQHPPKTDAEEQRLRDGPVITLMRLNKAICQEVAQVLYEERFFVIHVHEGLLDGGIEFLETGRLPLHFQEGVHDQRFHRFTRDSDFGFDRLKKIDIQIYQARTTDGRHTAINTYLVNLALCRLLDGPGSEADRITDIEIRFVGPEESHEQVGRRAILRAEQYWWDPEKRQPRETSVHNVSDIELVLRPFANLTRCHNVNIFIPKKLAEHRPTRDFVIALEKSMASKSGSLLPNDDLEMNIEIAKFAMEDYVKFIVRRKAKEEMERMALEEVWDNVEPALPSDEDNVAQNVRDEVMGDGDNFGGQSNRNAKRGDRANREEQAALQQAIEASLALSGPHTSNTVAHDSPNHSGAPSASHFTDDHDFPMTGVSIEEDQEDSALQLAIQASLATSDSAGGNAFAPGSGSNRNGRSGVQTNGEHDGDAWLTEHSSDSSQALAGNNTPPSLHNSEPSSPSPGIHSGDESSPLVKHSFRLPSTVRTDSPTSDPLPSANPSHEGGAYGAPAPDGYVESTDLNTLDNTPRKRRALGSAITTQTGNAGSPPSWPLSQAAAPLSKVNSENTPPAIRRDVPSKARTAEEEEEDLMDFYG